MAIREELTLGIQNWQRNLDQARNDVRRFHDENKRAAVSSRAGGGGVGTRVGGALAGAGSDVLASMGLAGGITGLTLAVKNALTEADDLADLTVALNESAEALQRVDFAGQQAASMGVDQISKAMLKLERSLGDVENKEAAEALANLGLSAERFGAMAIDEKVLALAGAFQKARADGTGLKDIQDLMGRSAAELVPLLEQGEEALRGMFERAPVMAEETVQQMARVNDQIDEMIAKSKTWLANAVGGVSGIGSFVADVIGTTPGEFMAFLMDPKSQIDQALLNVADQDTATAQDAAERERKRQETAKGQQAAADRAASDSEEKRRTDEADKKEEEIRKRREAAEKQRERDVAAYDDAAFRMMTPEQQMSELKRQIEKSLGVGNAGDRASIIEGADALAKAGRPGEAAEVLKDLADLEAIAGRMPAAAMATGAQGSFANLMDQIFGRGPQEQQLEEIRRQTTLAEDTSRTLDLILGKMNEPPIVDVFSDDGF